MPAALPAPVTGPPGHFPPSDPLPLLAANKDAIYLRIGSFNYPKIDQIFRQGGGARFDDPKKVYSTMYCAPDFETCYAETLIRDMRWDKPARVHLVPRSAHADKSLQTLVVDVAKLKLVDLFSSNDEVGLNNASGLQDYDFTRWLAREIYEHPEQPAGIWYLSKYAKGHKPALVLFGDRAKRHVKFYNGHKPLLLTKPALVPLLDALKTFRPNVSWV
jgi:hypothetical protein